MILITRPIDQALKTALLFERSGLKTYIAPLISISYPEHNLKLKDDSIILCSSANAIVSAGKDEKIKIFPIICVGSASASTAQELGFKNIICPFEVGDMETLLRWFIEEYQGFRGKILYLRGQHITVDAKRILEQAGFNCREEIVYQANETDLSPPELWETIAQHKIKYITFYSQRTAEVFTKLCLQQAPPQSLLKNIQALCFGDSIAQVLPSNQFKGVIIASTTHEIIAKLNHNEG